MSSERGLAAGLSTAKYTALFEREAREQLRAARAAVASLASGGAGHRADELFRCVHTLKGMAAAMGYVAVEQIAHAIEDALARLRTAPTAGCATATPLLTSALDVLDDAVAACIDPTRSAASERETAAVVNALASAAFPSGSVAVSDHVSHDAARGRGNGSAERSSAPPPAVTDVARQTLRVEVTALDRLLDLSGELVAIRERLAAAAARTGDAALARTVGELTRVSGAIADEVRATRLVGIAELYAELPRVVRHAAQATGKHATLETAGGDVVADRAVIDALAEPLIHLLRNAVDHGLELPGEREAAGKPREGRLTVRAARDGNALVVHVDDDGRGVDRVAVVARARARGQIPHAGAAAESHGDGAIDDATLLACLALPGLTTARAVGSVSGRGIGVDAALARVRALGGALTLRTIPGAGTRFSLRLPLSWAVVPSLVVRSAGTPYALPLVHVRETRDRGDAPTPPTSLAALLEDAPADRASVGGEVVVLAPTSGGTPVAVTVDEVTGVRDCVLKPIDAIRGAFRIAAGATILDRGEVALVLDIPTVAGRAATPPPVATGAPPCPSPSQRPPSVTVPAILAR